MILGKEVVIIKICNSPPGVTRITLWDPDEATVNGIKRLLELEKQARDDEHTAKKQ